MMVRLKRVMLGAAGTATLVMVPGPAAGQTNRDAVLDQLVSCAGITDLMVRVACYDKSIRPLVPSSAPVPPDLGTQPRAAGGPGGNRDGAPMAGQTGQLPPPLPVTARAEPRSVPGAVAPAASRAAATVALVEERAPGLYRVTLADGTSWEFADTVPGSYRPPQRGSMIEIDRGALGGTRLRFDRQQAVRVRQVR